jgi:formate hydrogenlyase subunit 4
MIAFLLEIGQAGLAFLVAPALVGVIRRVKARMQGRRGAPVWQPQPLTVCGLAGSVTVTLALPAATPGAEMSTVAAGAALA